MPQGGLVCNPLTMNFFLLTRCSLFATGTCRLPGDVKTSKKCSIGTVTDSRAKAAELELLVLVPLQVAPLIACLMIQLAHSIANQHEPAIAQLVERLTVSSKR